MAFIAVPILISIGTAMSCTTPTQTVVPKVSFNHDLMPILQTSCAINSSCHSGVTNKGDNVDFDSSQAYNSMVSKHLLNTTNPSASLLYVEINTGTMPKAPYLSLSAAQTNLFLLWLEQGAPNN